ncbi:hypothetical protein AB0M44_01605 [Streptosporangium subroseum]|uniref:hypothetical protein n=1 Tax=Streptosporangium subroseum TaxID=106412 RepID=UPI003448A35A
MRSSPGGMRHLAGPRCRCAPGDACVVDQEVDVRNASIELKDPTHPASEMAGQARQQLTDHFAEQAKLDGAADPATLAIQLTVPFDGLSARVMMCPGSLNGVGVRTAVVLLDANGLPPDA